MTTWDTPAGNPLQDILAAQAMVEVSPGLPPTQFYEMPVDVRPPTDFDPITPTPIMLMNVGPERTEPVCRTLGCNLDCWNEGYCDDEYMLYHERPHIWQGDYA